MSQRCESCGRFVSNRHLKTIRHFYDIDHTQPVAVYSLATATRYQERLDCAGCSMPCCLMREAERDHGVAVGRCFPNGWEPCAPETTQADYRGASDRMTPHRRPPGRPAPDTRTDRGELT